MSWRFMLWRGLFSLVLGWVCGLCALRASSGFDSGWPLQAAIILLDDEKLNVGWVRIQANAFDQPLDPAEVTSGEAIGKHRRALQQIRANGMRVVCMVRWGRTFWPSGVRPGLGRGNRAPLDLREAYARGYALAATYGNLVDAWEIENEPDIGFFADGADVFAAYHKALALGIADGRTKTPGFFDAKDAKDEPSAENGIRDHPRHPRLKNGLGGVDGMSRVVMPAMCLPPGPYYAQLQANGLLSYTEGLNFHYYGYAEHYAGVARLWKDVWGEEQAYFDAEDAKVDPRSEGVGRGRRTPPGWGIGKSERRGSATPPYMGDGGSGNGALGASRYDERTRKAERRLPIFTTEWGYALLDGYDAQTVAGRVRQWDFFRTVAPLNAELGIEAPMAFLLRPYYEHKMREFGLAMVPDERRAAHYGFVVDRDEEAAKKTENFDAKDAKDEPRSGGAKERVEGADLAGRAVTPLTAGIGTRSGAERSPRPTGDDGNSERRGAATPPYTGETFTAGGLTFRAEDFGASEVEPWMRRIGERVGDSEASPALAWLLESASEILAHETHERTLKRTEDSGRGFRDYPRWPKLRDGSRALPATSSAGAGVVVRTEAPSPVVIDFIAGNHTQAVKSWQGYWLGGEFREEAGGMRQRAGEGTLVLYNFGREAAVVRIEQVFDAKDAKGEPRTGVGTMTDDQCPMTNDSERVIRDYPRRQQLRNGLEGLGGEIVLAAGERREIAVRGWARADAFLPTEVALVAKVESGGVRTVSRWGTRFYAAPAEDYVERVRRDFGFATAEGQANRELLLARPHARGEPRLTPQGRWLVTDGVRMEETVRGWRIHVEHFPGDPYRPAMVELPLPEGWRMEVGDVLSYDYRLLPGAGAVELSPEEPDVRRRRQSGVAGAQAESYVRTRNGNLYSTVPRLEPKAEWQRYTQGAETLTLLFSGPAELPWRFAENTPASLVFFVRPAQLPAVLEIRDPAVVRYGRAEGAK